MYTIDVVGINSHCGVVVRRNTDLLYHFGIHASVMAEIARIELIMRPDCYLIDMLDYYCWPIRRMRFNGYPDEAYELLDAFVLKFVKLPAIMNRLNGQVEVPSL